MAEAKTRRMFDLSLSLMVIGLLGIVAINAALAVALSRAVTSSLVHREAQVTQEFLNSILSSEGTAERLFNAAELASFAQHVRSLPGTVRANIYSPDGFIRHSTDPNLVGVQFRENPELQQSFGGRLVATLETVTNDSKAEHLALNQLGGEKLIEAYIPVADAAGKVVAVVEFYRKATAIEATVSGITTKIWFAAALNALILIGAIMLGKRRV